MKGKIEKNKIETPLRKCIVCGEFIPRNTKKDEKRISPKQYSKALFCNNKCRGVHLKDALKGNLNPNWKGGVSSENERIRGSSEYKLWRTAVFQRDDFTCIWCLQRGGELNADHIKPFALFPELRFAIDNGRTLCISCHKTTDTYKIKNLTKK